ncbi:MAG: pitrilysin family protein [Candidatus Daviesbacteria bacterium]|nr:pitrilysin family protein [Candidatus Daviesbacteria bacterium]
MLKTFKLKNGIQVATYNLPDLRSIHLEVITKSGSLVETTKNNGVAHFMEHMLVQGTPSFPSVEDLSGHIESLAGSYGAYTSNLTVGFHITLPKTHLKDAVQISSEVFFEPLFANEAIDRERQVIIEEIREKMDSHWFKINEFFRAVRFGENHPLNRNPAGQIEIVKILTRDDLTLFWKKYFLPTNTSIVVTGKFDPDQLLKLLEKYFGQYKSQEAFPGFPKITRDDFSRRQVSIRHDKSLGSNYLDLAFPILDLLAPLNLRVKQNLAFVVLGGIRNSRLFKLLRYQRGLVYNVSSGAATWPGLGYGYIGCEVSTENLDEVVSLISRELSALYKNGPTDSEIAFVKNYLNNQWLMSFDHPSAITGWMENDLLWNDKIRMPEEYIEMIKDFTAKECVEIMKKYWDFSKLVLTIQGPLKSSKENIKKFEALIQELK